MNLVVCFLFQYLLISLKDFIFKTGCIGYLTEDGRTHGTLDWNMGAEQGCGKAQQPKKYMLIAEQHQSRRKARPQPVTHA